MTVNTCAKNLNPSQGSSILAKTQKTQQPVPQVLISNTPPTLTTSTGNDEMDVENSPSAQPRVAERPPPIFVYGITNYTAFSTFLRESNVADCLRKETSNALILTTKTADQYRKLHAVLRAECTEAKCAATFGAIQLHSYQLKSDRAFVIYIRGLPSTLDTEEISSALSERRFVPRRVTNVPNKVDGKLVPLPLFRVELEPNSLNSEIYNLTDILQVRVKVEPFKPRRDLHSVGTARE